MTTAVEPKQRPFSRTPGLLYRLRRAVARLWLLPRRVRLLGAERISSGGYTFLLVNSEPGFRDILLLTAALRRPVAWIHSGLVRATASTQRAAAFLSAGAADLGASSMGADFAGSRDSSGATGCQATARLAIRLANDAADPVEVAIHRVDIFAPPRGSAAKEILIAVSEPTYPSEYLHRAGGDPAEATRALEIHLEDWRRSNPFRLATSDLAYILQDVEEILLRNIEDDWASRPEWRQNAKEMELSDFVSGWARQSIALDPAAIVALSERVDAYRRARQRWASFQYAADTAGKWIRSSFRRTLVWFESLVGFPLALYGSVNHALPAAVYALLRWFDRSREANSSARWIAAGIGVLTGYTAQIILCDRWFGRAAAGYYALTLPLAGAYLWRYLWLARHRTPGVLNRLLAPLALRRLRLAREAVVSQLDKQIAEVSEPSPIRGRN